MYKLLAAGLIFLTIPAYSQPGCGDLNCNGNCYEIQDMVIGMIMIGDRCGFEYFDCTVDYGDVDGDGIPITISDVMFMIYIINASDPPDFQQNPDSDTITIQSAEASPGDVLDIPISINTADVITAFQFTVQFDTNIISIDTITFIDSLMKSYSICDGYAYGYGFSPGVWEGDEYTYLPGEHHIADIRIIVNPDISEPTDTYLEFLNDPENLNNTGFSNVPFIIPVTVDGGIHITPTGIEDRGPDQSPRDMAIDVYPNPFNGTASIIVNSPGSADLVIYDIAGRAVRRFPVLEGTNHIGWNATDDRGVGLGSGIYFARISGAPASKARKIVYLK